MQIALHLQDNEKNIHVLMQQPRTHTRWRKLLIYQIFIRCKCELKKWWRCPRTPVSLPAYQVFVYFLSPYTLSRFLNTSSSLLPLHFVGLLSGELNTSLPVNMDVSVTVFLFASHLLCLPLCFLSLHLPPRSPPNTASTNITCYKLTGCCY